MTLRGGLWTFSVSLALCVPLLLWYRASKCIRLKAKDPSKGKGFVICVDCFYNHFWQQVLLEVTSNFIVTPAVTFWKCLALELNQDWISELLWQHADLNFPSSLLGQWFKSWPKNQNIWGIGEGKNLLSSFEPCWITPKWDLPFFCLVDSL